MFPLQDLAVPTIHYALCHCVMDPPSTDTFSYSHHYIYLAVAGQLAVDKLFIGPDRELGCSYEAGRGSRVGDCNSPQVSYHWPEELKSEFHAICDLYRTLVSNVFPKWTDMDPNRHSFILLQNRCSQLGHLSADTTLTGKGVFLCVLPFNQRWSRSQQLASLQLPDKGSLAFDQL